MHPKDKGSMELCVSLCLISCRNVVGSSSQVTDTAEDQVLDYVKLKAGGSQVEAVVKLALSGS